MGRVRGRIEDKRVLGWLKAFLQAGILTEEGHDRETITGTPQGGILSPLLANVALHVLDEAWQRNGWRLGVLLRYADDLVVLCPTKSTAEQARQRVAEVLAPLGLRLHPDKTRIAWLAKGQEGFDFLGFHHHKVESWKWRGRYYLQSWPSDRAMNSIRAAIRERTDRRRVGELGEA